MRADGANFGRWLDAPVVILLPHQFSNLPSRGGICDVLPTYHYLDIFQITLKETTVLFLLPT